MPFKTLPGMGELVDGKINVKALRDVSYRDLLRRKPVELDRESISGYLNQKVVMVTGAGGSIGSELCRQIIRFNPRQLVLLDACEAVLYRVQMERGGPITVTRYFMTIPEASQLILQAGAQGEGGETFILEMGESIKIADMARDLIRLSGKVPDEDIEIKFTGLRQGEKLFEELITEGEGIVPTSHEKIMVLKANGNWNGHGTRERYHDWLMDRLNGLYAVADDHDVCVIREKMQEIVPEFKVQDSKCVL